MPKKVKKRHLLNYSILIPYLILCILGLIMVYSSSSYLLLENGSSPSASFFNQSLFWGVSLVAIGLLYKMKTSVLKNQRLIMAAIAVLTILLLIVLFFGKEINGAKGWLQIAGFSLQPAEYLKIIVKRPLLLVLALTALVAILPDFGNATVIFLIILVLLLASGINYVYTLIVGVGGVGLSALAIWLINITHGKIFPGRLQYIYNRFAIYQNPFSDELNKGHQLANGYYAMFNGGLFGRGLGNSIQKKGFLNEAQTDFIYAIVVEELGVIMGILILALLFFMIVRIFLVGIRSKDPFNSLLCIGIGAMFMIQIFINLGGITGVIPLTGITFPFLSQGGSSLLMLSICVGFVLNISADEKRKSLGLY